MLALISFLPSPSWQPPPGRSLFGGILIGAAINAAQQTVAPDFYINHLSCTFRAAPDATKPLFYRVSRASDRRSGAVREVKAEQSGVVFFSAECSFSLVAGRPRSVTHQSKPPAQLKNEAVEVPPPPKLADNNEKAFAEKIVSQVMNSCYYKPDRQPLYLQRERTLRLN